MSVSWPKLTVLLLLAGFVGGGATCEDQTVTVWIDNGDAVEISVAVNGGEAVTVGPGERRSLACPPGLSVFTIRSGDDVPRLESHFLRPPEGDGSKRCYLLNPERSRYYLTANVEYGLGERRRIVDMVMQSGLLNEQQRRNVVYHRLRREIQLLPMTGWHDITKAEYRFQSPPKQLLISGTCDRVVTLQSVPHELYCQLTATTGKQSPCEADCQRLCRVTQHAIATF